MQLPFSPNPLFTTQVLCDYQQPMTTEGETPSEHWIFIIITIIIIIMNDGDNGTRNNNGEHDVRIVCSGRNKKYTTCKFRHIPSCSL
jgi:hypothetical protein